MSNRYRLEYDSLDSTMVQLLLMAQKCYYGCSNRHWRDGTRAHRMYRSAKQTSIDVLWFVSATVFFHEQTLATPEIAHRPLSILFQKQPFTYCDYDYC